MTLLSRVSKRESVCTEFAGKTAADNADKGKTSGTTTGTRVEVSAVMLAVSVLIAVANMRVDDSDDGAGGKGAGSKSTPSTCWGSCWCSTETSPAWDIARSAETAPDGAEDGCEKNCKGFPLPTPGAKFGEGLEAIDRWAATSVAATDGSGSEGGFAESESPVVLASDGWTMFSTAVSTDGASWGIGRGTVGMAAALEDLRRLLETMLVISGRWSSKVGSFIISICLSSNESLSNSSTLNIYFVVAAGLG